MPATMANLSRLLVVGALVLHVLPLVFSAGAPVAPVEIPNSDSQSYSHLTSSGDEQYIARVNHIVDMYGDYGADIGLNNFELPELPEPGYTDYSSAPNPQPTNSYNSAGSQIQYPNSARVSNSENIPINNRSDPSGKFRDRSTITEPTQYADVASKYEPMVILASSSVPNTPRANQSFDPLQNEYCLYPKSTRVNNHERIMRDEVIPPFEAYLDVAFANLVKHGNEYSKSSRSNNWKDFSDSECTPTIGSDPPGKDVPVVKENATPNASENVTPNMAEYTSPRSKENVTSNSSENVTPNVSKNVTPNVSKNAIHQSKENVTPNVSKNVTHNLNENATPFKQSRLQSIDEIGSKLVSTINTARRSYVEPSGQGEFVGATTMHAGNADSVPNPKSSDRNAVALWAPIVLSIGKTDQWYLLWNQSEIFKSEPQIAFHVEPLGNAARSFTDIKALPMNTESRYPMNDLKLRSGTTYKIYMEVRNTCGIWYTDNSNTLIFTWYETASPVVHYKVQLLLSLETSQNKWNLHWNRISASSASSHTLYIESLNNSNSPQLSYNLNTLARYMGEEYRFPLKYLLPGTYKAYIKVVNTQNEWYSRQSNTLTFDWNK
eukprot:481432_1